MLELATTPVTDLPQDSVQSSIDVLFAEKDGLRPQPFTLHYLVTPDGTPYLRLDSFCHIVFSDFGTPDHIYCLVSFCAKYQAGAKYLDKNLFMPLDKLKLFAKKHCELLDLLVDSKARFEGVVLRIASLRCESLSKDADELYKLVLNDYQQKCKA